MRNRSHPLHKIRDQASSGPAPDAQADSPAAPSSDLSMTPPPRPHVTPHSEVSSSPPPASSPSAAARPLRDPALEAGETIPRRRRRTSAHRRRRPGLGAAAAPGTRFARGTRFGSPADVTPPEDGACTTSAARQPSSAGEAQPGPASPSRPNLIAAWPPWRNQSDSTASKIGSRFAV